MNVLDGNDHDNELKEEKLRVIRHKENFKVVRSCISPYAHCYEISSNYENSNLIEFWQDKRLSRSLGGFALFIDLYDPCLILNYIISYLIKGF